VNRVDAQAAPAEEFTPTDRGQQLLELANAVVRVHKQLSGKGPTKARAYVQQDLVVVVLEGGFTRGEQTLQAAGHHRELMHARLAIQHAGEAQLRNVVETILGRRVLSFMSANDPKEGYQAELFVLEPEPRTHYRPLRASPPRLDV
jgi:uncharacterized protein YbcI